MSRVEGAWFRFFFGPPAQGKLFYGGTLLRRGREALDLGGRGGRALSRDLGCALFTNWPALVCSPGVDGLADN